MHIWVDGQCFQTPSATRGIGRYVIEFLQELVNSGAAKLTISLNANLPEQAVSARAVLRRALPSAEIAVWRGVTRHSEADYGITDERDLDMHILAAHINALGPDIALFASMFEGEHTWAVPILTPSLVTAATACIFYDAIPFRFPAAYLFNDNLRRSYMRRLDAVKEVDLVLAISDFSATEYQDICGKNNVVPIYAGLSDRLMNIIQNRTEPGGRSFAQSLGSYVLYVGGGDWRKNIPFLVRAMSQIPDCRSGALKLVVSGLPDNSYSQSLTKLWAALGLSLDKFIVTGWVSDVELVDLYRHARISVQPSLMEGFGLTALEAMASSCVVLVARGGASSEVVGLDSLLFDPIRPAELINRVTEILSDDEYRDKILLYGQERAKQFTWKRTASIALNAFREYLDNRNKRRNRRRRPAPAVGAARLIMDVTSTTKSRANSGIQRVMRRITEEMLASNDDSCEKTVLTYCHETSGIYELPQISRRQVNINSRTRHIPGDSDTILLLDSTWVVNDQIRQWCQDALLHGRDVVHGIYDLGPITMPAMTGDGMPAVFQNWLRFAFGHSTGLICISRTVADEVYELISAIKLPRPMKIGYFRLGSDFADVEAERGWATFLGGRKTFLMVGTIEPRKAHRVALEAFEKLWREGVEANLLIIGKPGWNTKMLLEKLRLHPENDKHLFLRTGVSDGELRAAYEAAEALIMTSYLEGFGLPVAEAGHLGCPVIAADIPIFREVGDAAPSVSFFSPESSEELAQCIREALRAPMMRGSLGRASWPNWLESAEELREVIFGGNWYRYYEPAELSPAVQLSDIGSTSLTRSLSPEERSFKLRYVEGPLLSDGGDTIKFIVGVRNDSDLVWSSQGRVGGLFGINLGAHIYDADEMCLEFELPRTPIPFVLYPGQEILLPINILTEWLLRGGQYIEIELVQEGVSWFGDALRADLRQTFTIDDDSERRGNWRDIRLGQFHRLPSSGGRVGVLFVAFNSGDESVHFGLGDGSVSLQFLDRRGGLIEEAALVSCASALNPFAQGFICFAADKESLSHSVNARVQLSSSDGSVYSWWLDFEGNMACAEPPPIGVKPLASRMRIDIESYSDLLDDAFVHVLYHRITGRVGDATELRVYEESLATRRLSRAAVAHHLLKERGGSDRWEVLDSERSLVEESSPEMDSCSAIRESDDELTSPAEVVLKTPAGVVLTMEEVIRGSGIHPISRSRSNKTFRWLDALSYVTLPGVVRTEYALRIQGLRYEAGIDVATVRLRMNGQELETRVYKNRNSESWNARAVVPKESCRADFNILEMEVETGGVLKRAVAITRIELMHE